MTDRNDRKHDTAPGALLQGYKRLKGKIAGLIGRGGGTVPAGQDWKTAGNEDTPDEVRSQEEMKTAFGEGDGPGTGGPQENERPVAAARPDGSETAVYEEAVPQDVREQAEADAKADAESDARLSAEDDPIRSDADDARSEDDGGRTGTVELEGPELRAEERGAPRAADLPPAARTSDAPSMTDLDRRALRTLAEDEVGTVPSDGMGLDDTPRDAINRDA